jgi:hypothetical protein
VKWPPPGPCTNMLGPGHAFQFADAHAGSRGKSHSIRVTEIDATTGKNRGSYFGGTTELRPPGRCR